MSLNLTEIGQLALRNLKNAGEILRNLWKLHFDPTPQDVMTEIYDENGNLKQVSIPNVSKWRDTIWKDAQSAMSKTFYVDQINGNDTTGDGSQTAPFATIQKAIDSITIGGAGIILLANGQTHPINTTISLINKTIFIQARDSINADFPDLSNTQNAPVIEFQDGGKILLSNSFIGFGNYYYGVYIKDTLTSRDAIIDSDNAFAGGGSELFLSGLDTAHSRVALTDNAVIHLSDIRFRKSAINHSGATTFLSADRNTLILRISEVFLRNTDDTNSTWTWSDVINGIVRDANGVPRNIMSNLIL